jgi:mono/diheme cytochrome c family protein
MQRAKYHYQMHCQGCHTEDGRGFNDVPQLQGYLGYFLQVDAGREYLVRVPGSANADLSDSALAELLNWMLLEFSQASLAPHWQAYTSEEVGQYRRAPLLEVIEHRKQLTLKIEQKIKDQSQ